MKNIFLFALLLGSLNLFAQEIEAFEEDTLYYIHLFSTNDLQLVRAEHLNLGMIDDEIIYEKEVAHYNFLVFYGDLETAEVMLHTWQRFHKYAFICTRTTKDAKGLYPFYIKN
jgi:hypothetical protein